MIRCDRQTVKTVKGNVKDVKDQVKTLSDYKPVFFLVQMSWTESTSQMIQDDSQLTFRRDWTSNRRRWKNEQKSLLERKGKVWVYIK